MNKNAVEPVENQNSLGFYNRLFLVPKPNNRWRPILDLSTLNTFLNTESFKIETPETIRTSLQAGEWVTSIDFKDTYFHIPIHSQSRKYMRFHLQGRSYQFKALPFGLSTAPMKFTVVAKEVKLMALQRGIRIHQYLDDWLVIASSHETCLQHTQTLVVLCQDVGWLVNKEKSELVQKQVFNFVGYQFDLKEGKVRPTPDCWQALTDQIQSILSGMPGPTVHVPHRSSHSNRKASPPRVTSHEAHTVALEKQLEGPRITREGDPSPQVAPPPPKVVAGGKQCATRSTFTPSKRCSANIYRRIKRRVGHSLRRAHCKGNFVPSRKQVAHKLPRAKSSFSSSKRVSKPLLQQDSTDSYRQHNSGCLYQQRGGDEIGLPVCPTMENPVLVHQEAGDSQGMPHPRLAEHDSRQAIQTGPDHSNRVVTSSRSVQNFMLLVAPAPSRSVCPQVQHQTTTVCLTGPRPPMHGQSMHSAFPGRTWTHMPFHQQPSWAKWWIAPGWPNMPWFWDLVAMSSQMPLCLPNIPNLVSQPFNQVLHRNLSNLNLHAWLLEPERSRSKASLRQWQHELRLLKEDQPDLSMRQNGPFTTWGHCNQVDFRAPPLKAIADFLLHLFQDKKLQPGTIDGYRSAIADKLGNTTINVSKDENLTRLLESFHRDRPKGWRGIPSWNLSLVMHQLTKAPFEPLKEASLKHLTFKTVFLMALGSGKRRSEIHAWLHKNIRHQSDWSKVSLCPSPSFLSKNQLAKEGPDSVAPVVIPALAPSLDKSLKGDRSLCPVRTLRYYLDRTSDLRQNKELVFVSFKKGFDKDISPATISLWIKQTVTLCYELSDQEALTLHQVKAHDVRAFAASNTFQSGVSLEQILSACHWKSHNTFTQFYLKDVSWADSELFHLGPVVAAQQVHHQVQK